MRSLSVRARTTLIAVIAFGVAATIASIGLVVTLRASLLDEVDRSIDSRAADIAAQVASDSEFVSLGIGIDTDTLAVVYSLDGALYDSTDLSVDLVELDRTWDETDVAFDVSLPGLTETNGSDNMRATVLVVPLLDLDSTVDASELQDDDFIVYVATTLDPLDRTVGRVSLGALVVAPLLVLIVATLTWVLTGRSLAPVEAIRREVEEISDDELSRRVPEPASDDEIGRLATTMNEMLTRLDTANERQRRFVADASHELRSPLASMAARLDVAMRHGDDDEWRSVAASMRTDVDRLHHLVEDLLLLARPDASGGVNGGLVDLDDVVLDAVRELDSGGGPTIDASRVSAGLVMGDASQLRRVVTNLVANARRHAETRVDVTLLTDDDRVLFIVDDDGPGIDPADRDRVFERFVRLDEARARDAGGSGLGLAIAREIVLRHGGAIGVDESPLGGARVAVSLPSR